MVKKKKKNKLDLLAKTVSRPEFQSVYLIIEIDALKMAWFWLLVPTMHFESLNMIFQGERQLFWIELRVRQRQFHKYLK